MNTIKSYFTSLLILSFILIGCEKFYDYSKKDSIEYISSEESSDLSLRIGENSDNNYEKIIISPLVKNDQCKYIVSGTIEYHLNGELVATIDYGDGTCDDIATKTYDGETIEFSLARNGSDKYEKIIVEPLISTENCDFITSGIIEFYIKNVWQATIDYGDGTCDKWATKTWDPELFPEYPSGSKTFSLSSK